MTLAGEVQYKESRLPIAPAKLNDEMRGLIRATIERVGGAEPPPKVPSVSECRFCELTAADCPERVDEARAAAPVETDLF